MSHNMNSLISRGFDINPWNLPQDDEWAERFLSVLPEEVMDRLHQFNNIPEDDDEIMTENSEATTMLMDFDDNYDEEEDAATVQHHDITSSTSTISTLNAVNMVDIHRRNLWLLQPALNSVYDNLISDSSLHNKQTTGNFKKLQ